MQSTTSFDWGRAVTPARWVARIIGGIYFVLYLASAIFQAFGAIPTALDWVLIGIIGVGLVLAIVFTGIGEVVGGLAFVGAGVVFAFWTGFELGGLLYAVAPLVIVGLLFIACGWYVLNHERPHAHITA